MQPSGRGVEPACRRRAGIEPGSEAGGYLAVLGAGAAAALLGLLFPARIPLAPRGAAAGYLATDALVTGAASALAPILAGLSADWLETSGSR